VAVRPAHLRPDLIALVVLGGALGTTARNWIEATFAAPPGAFPWPTFWINVTGALVLGALLEALALLGPDRGLRRGLRLALGTGVLGGYTTYSTFVIETVTLGRAGNLGLAVAYDAASLAAGFAAALLASWACGRFVRRRFARQVAA
jgi:CrcB protein